MKSPLPVLGTRYNINVTKHFPPPLDPIIYIPFMSMRTSICVVRNRVAYNIGRKSKVVRKKMTPWKWRYEEKNCSDYYVPNYFLANSRKYLTWKIDKISKVTTNRFSENQRCNIDTRAHYHFSSSYTARYLHSQFIWNFSRKPTYNQGDPYSLIQDDSKVE